MKKHFKNYKFLALAVLVFMSQAALINHPSTPAGQPWVAPAAANDKQNPLKGHADATAEGKKLYNTYCVVCHGNKGKGDGIAASGLQKQPADHTSGQVQNQSDGALFWKMSEGRSPMPPYKAALTETQRWQLVNYIRTLAKASKK